ncbi:TniB family NTP-binding protein [Bacillus mycoides]|uniref:TniB family NTP-binding protein n=1 Tax=Bacillus mycoides TaxID=1405 RepID=UPI00292D7DB8|nr:TniB family NTP-binding protein [Bacillus mycoides]WOA57218.1 AAA family ATPase [Bacillus mycoides]
MKNEEVTYGNMSKECIEDKIEAFKRIRIIHPKMKKVMDKLKLLIEQPSGNEIIMVLGPSGVGKSTLIQSLKKDIIEKAMEELERDKSRLPLVLVELVSPDNGLFNWKDFYIRILNAMEEPLIHKKVLYKNKDGVESEKKNYANHNPRTAPELRRSVENAFYYRKPKVFIVDEAQHFTKMASGKRYIDQLDTLKSLSNLTKIPQVLVGTYGLEDFVNLNGQLARRTTDIQFSRYDLSIEEDFNNYLGIIKGLLGSVPIPVSDGLINHYEYIYERSIGCVGVLKDWLMRSLKLALEENASYLTLSHMKRTALSINKISKLLDEILIGEELFLEKDDTLISVRSKLGLNNQEFSIKSKERIKGVGNRNPKRDKVGVNLIGGKISD